MIVWKIVQELGGAEVDVMDLLEEVATNPSLIKDIVPFIVGQESPEKQAALSWNYNDLFLWASFEGYELNIQTQMFKWYDITLGNCFTFNHKNSTKYYQLRKSGENGGFKALMKLQQSEYLSWINTAALIVFVHTMEETIFQESVRYQIASGNHGTIMTNKLTYKRLCGKYGDCIVDSSKVKAHYYPGSYTTSGCLRGCYQDAVQKACNCMDPRYAMPLSAQSCNLSAWKCVANVTKVKGDASNWESCHCPAPCEESQYESHYQIGSSLSNPIQCSKLSNSDETDTCLEEYKDLAMVTVYVPKLTHKVFSESPKMSVSFVVY
uniref:Uncharacterized protein n=1 Tax=Panagrolaimus superbus TaxID=310955 RepID=A0A914ZB22_9BILA